MTASSSEVTAAVQAAFRARTPRSAQLQAAADRYLPGGNTRSLTYYEPYPAFIARGAGCRLYDVDGNEYVDFANNYTALIHGHAHPAIVEAACRQIAQGTAWPAPTESQVQLAELLCSRVASVEQVRFCNSGTEATLNAIRAARAFTGRDQILKMEGGYHGSHETVEVSISPALSDAGPANRPLPVPEGAGISRSVLGDVIVAPFNDLEATASLIRKERDQLAAVIVEPMLGSTGMIPATREFLQGVRAVTRECNVLLIADEVITFRLAWGGAQAIYDVEPDLTAFAKIIGGGFPVGAFGGRREIMALFNPTGGRIPHSGTFNGNPVTMVAGLAAMQLLTKPEIARINALGERLAQGMREAFEEVGLAGQVTGMGSTLNIHLTPHPVVDYRSGATASKKASRLLHLALLSRGIFTVPRGMFCISTPMDNQIVDDTIIRFTDALIQVRPALEEEMTP